MIPEKLKAEDEVRIISPSHSLAIISKEVRELAKKRLESLGLKVTFSKNVEENDDFKSSSIKSRVEDFHEAFSDKNVKMVLPTIGGFNCNQLLSYLDYGLIKKNPKIICGFSDTTALLDTIYKKTGLVTYYGPSFSSFGMKLGFDYTFESFKSCLMENKEISLTNSQEWSDDTWYKDQEKREFVKNEGFFIINEGETEGRIVGGNVCTFNLLQGTRFMPSLKNTILFLEDDEESNPFLFDRDLQSIIHQPDFKKVKGIVIGRFQKASKMTKELLVKIIKSKKELDKIPVIGEVDFGHTTPIITFPIGGKARIYAKDNKIEIKIVEH